jgi:hypothetical protein
MRVLVDKLGEQSAFENFVISEEDLYGVKSTLNEEEITVLVLKSIEELV